MTEKNLLFEDDIVDFFTHTTWICISNFTIGNLFLENKTLGNNFLMIITYSLNCIQ